MSDRCQSCARYLAHYTDSVVLNGKSYCGPETSECVYVGRRKGQWKFSPEDAQALLEQLFDQDVA